MIRALMQPHHFAHECTLRPVPCTFGCGVIVPARDLPHHESTDCEMRVVDCAAGCGMRMRFRDREAHELLECGHQTAPCKYSCGATPMVVLLRDHEENECPRRPTPCPRNCGSSLWHQDLPEHLLICPRRLLVCSRVTDSFEQDVLYAGRNGRSANDLAAMIRDDGDCAGFSSDSSSDGGGGDDGDAGVDDSAAPVRKFRRSKAIMDYTPDQQELMSKMTVEERFAFAVGIEKKRQKDRVIGTIPNAQLTHCFKVCASVCVWGTLSAPVVAIQSRVVCRHRS